MPEGVLMVTFPVAPAPTVAVTVVEETTGEVVGAVSPKVTEVAPERLVPMMVTTVPAGPNFGVKLVIDAAADPWLWSISKALAPGWPGIIALSAAMARSGRPSPSMSAAVMAQGPRSE